MLLPISTPAQRRDFEDECFRAWLNIVDARMGYDERREAGTVAEWRVLFKAGLSINEAIQACT